MPTRGGPSKLNSFALKLVHLYAPTLVHWAHHSRDLRRPLSLRCISRSLRGETLPGFHPSKNRNIPCAVPVAVLGGFVVAVVGFIIVMVIAEWLWVDWFSHHDPC